ncbi:hypothetical protein [Fischerella sp. PCC 9605]|jgi:hypothetical protein|uniref:hypothetical protein n=1 Tax=Fischerella sp. PCC 9605 TaxID=1173024 RepID=UPI0004B68367|nr:hypothetical protein [Fischerella sp. PCC 9605]
MVKGERFAPLPLTNADRFWVGELLRVRLFTHQKDFTACTEVLISRRLHENSSC